MKTKTWEINKLEEVCEILDNKRVPISSKNRIRGIYPYYGASGIVDYIDKYIFDEELVLIGEDGAKWGAFENSAFIAEGKYWVNNHAHILKPNNEILINKFLVYFLNYSNLEKYITGATVKKLNQQKLKQIEIPLPPLEEQMRIVKILDLAFEKIDTSVELLKANLANLDELAKSVLDRAFNPLGDSTESTQNPSTHDTQSPYPLPQHWEWKSLGEIASVIQSGFAINKSNEIADGYIHLRTHNIATDGNLNFETLVKVKKELIKEQQSFIEEGDILFNNTNSTELVGKTALVTQNYNYAFSNHITKIKLFNQYSPKLVVFYFVLLLKNKYFERICHKWIGQSGINTDKLKQIQIPLPKDIKEQEQIAMHLDSVFEKAKALKELYTKELKDYEELKQSLLDKAFKGEL
ncbi:restriction endonuclease subunit S [Campylobacter coli]|uniref:restriction endonuclease subunit S n=1 Tax=Campylobacter TaxID=194 RepID=UPI0007170AB1|nr:MULTISPECIES: restriction endonuclease subunit S [Campylobacter]EKT7749533.1 restriction endonuclease subunit S [Campylobacter jejuni]EAC2134655.1 restriction endonuclease subunit S [Campylobacter coli]EAC2134707.1 restriction endonuclease subunit S [Campylobacter coli]EAH4464323.1 restriction endonuclease subunit S [Campylobacter coli]EAH4465415.1 restriction endonuclease subunit S [Campylobacter coli]